jgi:hypothetical protein
MSKLADKKNPQNETRGRRLEKRTGKQSGMWASFHNSFIFFTKSGNNL